MRNNNKTGIGDIRHSNEMEYSMLSVAMNPVLLEQLRDQREKKFTTGDPV